MASQTFNADFATLKSLLQEYLIASILEGGLHDQEIWSCVPATMLGPDLGQEWKFRI